jgi:diacylglycerol O-acyltransferase / wax synthase
MGETSTAAHIGGLVVLDVAGSVGRDFTYARLLRLVEERIPLSPRYRQKLRSVPGWLADPVWVDDPRFDATYHLRRCTLARPGSDEQLYEFAARILSRPLDPGRPPWEMYLVEGLSGGRAALVTKAHVDLARDGDGAGPAQLVLDDVPDPQRSVSPIWAPAPEPSSWELVRDAVAPLVAHPSAIAPAAGRAAATVCGAAGGVMAGMSRAAVSLARRAPESPLRARTGEQRRVAVARTSLAELGFVANAFGGSVDDVALAVVAGALRGWLLSRSVPLRAAGAVRVMDGRSVLELPVGESDPVLRLAQVRHAAGDRTGISTAGERRVVTRRPLELVIGRGARISTPRFVTGARVTEVFAIQPLPAEQVVSIGIVSWEGTMFYGLNGDWDAMRDIGLMASLIEQSASELVDAASGRVRTRTGA